MRGLSDKDRQLIACFLTKNYELFQEFLDDNEIEPTEAELIIGTLAPGQLKKN